MSIASQFEPFDRDKVFYDLETWESMFAEELKASPAVADSLAWLLYRIIRELDQGKKGRERVINTMKLGVEWVYQYTDARRVSFKAFLYYLEGMLLSPGSVETILKQAIEQAEEAQKAFDNEKLNDTRPNRTKLKRTTRRRN